MMTLTKTCSKKHTFRGITLLEALLALGLGGIVIANSVIGIQEYTEGVRVQGAASQLKRLNRAAKQFARDNHLDLMANAPQEIQIDALEPYLGDNIGTDAFNNDYKMTTRTYQVAVPDPAGGGTTNEDFLQILVVGETDPDSEIATEPTIRIDVANTAGSDAGFFADGNTLDTCNGISVTDTDVCGAFGSYVIDTADFTATSDFDDAVVASLVTTGDSSFREDYLVRYDYGDPELNTMRTDLHMDDNDITNPGRITGVDGVSFDGGPQNITTNTGDLTVEPNRDLDVDAGRRVNISSGEDTIVLGDDPTSGTFFRIQTANDNLRFDTQQNLFGNFRTFSHGASTQSTGTGDIFADTAQMERGFFREINSLFTDSTDALRIQRDRNDSMTVFGRRVRYTPDNDTDAGIYEISDGDIIAQHASVQDITCADCGGSLSQILPKWRQMGTYIIPNDTIVRVPKPTCGSTRSHTVNRAAVGDDPEFQENDEDTRYVPKIVLVPRQTGFVTPAAGEIIDIRLDALDNGNEWLAEADTENGSAASFMTALAKTYCVFVGGTTNPALPPENLDDKQSSPAFDRLE